MLYRKCLAFVLVPVLGRELQDLMKLWNTHTVRYNRRTLGPHGIPNDLYAMPSESGYKQYTYHRYCINNTFCVFIGVTDQLCTLNVEVWEYLMFEASVPPEFYDSNFEHLAKYFLHRYYNISHKDFTPSNISEIYCNMVEYFT